MPLFVDVSNHRNKFILLQIFNNVIETSEKDPHLSIRLNTLYKEITLAVYTNISRGLFERHKLVFSFMLCIAIFQDKGEIDASQWNFLLRGPVGTTKTDLPKKPDYPMITDAMWHAAHYLSSNYESFAGLPGDLTKIIQVSVGDFSLVSI